MVVGQLLTSQNHSEMRPQKKRKLNEAMKKLSVKPKAKQGNNVQIFEWRLSPRNRMNWTPGELQGNNMSVVTWLKSLKKNKRIKTYMVQLEDSWLLDVADEEQEEREQKKIEGVQEHNLHYQGLFKSEKPCRGTSFKLRDIFKDWNVHIAPASNAGKESLKNYVSKDVCRVDGPWCDKRLYRGKDLIKQHEFTAAQNKFTELYHAPVHPRRAYWFFDPAGGCGKSAWIKWLQYHHEEEVCVITAEKSWDIQKLAAEQRMKKLYIVNLAKARPKDIGRADLYNALEGIKDGHFTTTKGLPVETVLMNIPTVMVFSNTLPNLKMMTRKRWFIIRLYPSSKITLDVPDAVDWGVKGDGGCQSMTEEEMKCLENGGSGEVPEILRFEYEDSDGNSVEVHELFDLEGQFGNG